LNLHGFQGFESLPLRQLVSAFGLTHGVEAD